MSEPRRQLITRGDDAGSCESANEAVFEAATQGVLRNASLMVPGPAFAGVAALFAGQQKTCLGLHVTLNAEWENVKWGPVLPAAQVPSLVDANGYFLPTPNDLHRRNASVEEMMAEVAAQLKRARELGLHITYLDEHMGVGWLPGLRDRLAAFAREEGLLDVHAVPYLPNLPEGMDIPADDLPGLWTARLAAAKPGAYVLVTHPGKDANDMRAFGHTGLEVGQVARERDAERRALTGSQLRERLRALDMDVIRYDAFTG